MIIIAIYLQTKINCVGIKELGFNGTVYAIRSKGRFAIHREYNLLSWKMEDEENFIERLREIEICLTRDDMLKFIEFSKAWGSGPKGDIKNRDLGILDKLYEWIKAKPVNEIFFECSDLEAEEFPIQGFVPDNFENETEW